MAWTFEVLDETGITGGGTTVTSGTISFDANKLLLIVGSGNDHVGATTDVTMTGNTTGLTFTVIDSETVSYSIGGSAVKVWACIPGSGGSGTVTITSNSTNNGRSVHAIQVDGADLSGGVAGVVVEVKKNHTVGTGGDPISVVLDNLAEGNAVFACGTSTISCHDQSYAELTSDYTGSIGCLSTGFSEDDVSNDYDGLGAGVLGGLAAISIELKGFAPPEPAVVHGPDGEPNNWSPQPPPVRWVRRPFINLGEVGRN